MIEVRRVVKIYDGEVRALDGASLAVEAGELVLLSGASGVGKSTLLRLLYAAERPDAGELRIAGRDIARLRRSSIPYLRRNLGLVSPGFRLLAERSVLENVALSLEVRNLPASDVRRRALNALAEVGLLKQATRHAGRLSPGEATRVALARAIAPAPAVLLCDEPTADLDPDQVVDLLELVLDQAQRGAAVLLATHDPGVVAFGRAHSCREVQLVAGRTAMPSIDEVPVETEPAAVDEPYAALAISLPGDIHDQPTARLREVA